VRKALVESCRDRAEQCRLHAQNARNRFDEEAWLDLAIDWTKLAEAIEKEDDPKWTN
jgi:hypothetical protein